MKTHNGIESIDHPVVAVNDLGQAREIYERLGFTATTVVKPHAGLSAAILPFAAAVTLLLSALVILKHRETPRPAEWAAAITTQDNIESGIEEAGR